MRFLVGVLLCLRRDPQAWLVNGSALNKQAFPEIRRKHFTSRRSLIDEGLDPLERIIGGLEVRRFITFNYDFEIERAFLDRGFRRFPRHDAVSPRQAPQPPGPADFAADAVGSLLRDQTFRRERAADLIGFCIGDPRDEASVFHLHGRATRDDPLVIAERDYMDLYLLEDQHRETVRDGIAMAFSGSPILFVGTGMTEAEILRPLRQFMANNDRTLGFSAVALMPAQDSLEKRTQFATSAYRRYGVHTVFYGGAEVEVDSIGPDKTRRRSLDWLHRVTLLIDGLKAHLDDTDKKLRDGGQSSGDTAAALMHRLMQKVGPVGDDLGGYKRLPSITRPDGTVRTIPISALMVLFGSQNIGMDETGPEGWTWFALASLRPAQRPLRIPEFTPVRRRAENVRSRHYSEDANVDAAKYLQLPVALLSNVFHLLIGRQSAWTAGDRAELASLRLMLDGLKGAILTGAMNAALEGLERGWQVWWQKWQDSPPHRVARFEHVDLKRPELPVLFVRHSVDNVLGPARDDWVVPIRGPVLLGQRDSQLVPGQRTGVRSFDTFIAAIASNHTQVVGRPDRGRVMFTVLAHRGLGKGTFVSAFSCPRGLSLYEAALWGDPAGATGTGAGKAFVLASVFVNFGFATEIASTFDMLRDVLIDATAVLEKTVARTRSSLRRALRVLEARRNISPAKPQAYAYAKPKVDDLRNDLLRHIVNLPRLQALREMMRQFEAAGRQRPSPDGQPRILIVLSSLDVLYDANKRIKNPEIAAWLDWLLGPEMACMPVDLVVLSSESGLGPPFDADPGKGGTAPWRIRLDREHLKPADEDYIRKRIAGGRLRLDEDTPHSAARAQALIGGETVSVTGATAPVAGATVPGTALTRSTTNFVHVVRPFSAVRLLLDNFKILATGLWLDAMVKDRATRAAFRDGIEKGLEESDTVTSALWGATDLPSAQELAEARQLVWKQVAARLGQANWLYTKEIEDRFMATPTAETERVLAWIRSVRHRLHENRFLMTILLAAAQNGIVLASDPMEGAGAARRFIDATIDRVRNSGADEAEEVVVRAVLEAYRARHRIGEPDRDSELHGLVLRHLGVIGGPVQVDVLVRLPEFRDYFDRLKIDLDTSRRRFLARALTVMAHRGLVFRIRPHPRQVILERVPRNSTEQPDWPVEEKHRYILHRVVQRHVLSRLQVGTRDAIAAGSFAPSLYAALPSPGDGLSTEGYNFIRALIVSLSQYPDIPRGDDRLRPWVFTTEQANIRTQALRHALTLARSTLSLPVFAALDGQTPSLQGQAKRGFLDTYKVRLRWLIRFAWESVYHLSQPEGIGPDDAERFRHLNALYRDEIVWLYNELGVIALAQGNLTEALGYLRLGREFNEPIEGPARRGPIGDRLALNYVAVQIERGRLEAAEKHVLNIKAAADPGTLLALLSDGYFNLINDLRGRSAGVLKGFADVVDGLEGLGEPRAQAIFLLHLARATFRTDPDKALSLIERAHALSSAGGHEDIRNRVELSRVELEWRSRNRADANWSRRLIAVEAYGRRMGIWSLQVDALRLRAERMLESGETGSAGQLLVRSMAIAQRNRMMLRLSGAMRVYARTLMERGETASAREMAADSLKLARRLRYALEEKRSSDLLIEVAARSEVGAVPERRLPL